MFTEQSTIFPKQIKIDDYQPYENNHLIILQSSNLLLGTGSRTSNAAIVLVKCLYYMIDEGEINLKNKKILELGSGTGLVGLYLAALGCNVTMSDTPALKDIIQKNININKNILKGQIEFIIASWKKTKPQQQKTKKQLNQTISTASSEKYKEVCLFDLIDNFDLTLVCECGGMTDLESQLQFMGKEGMILAYMRRQNWDEGLDDRQVEEYLSQNEYEYEKIRSYHPDYVDNRISIYRIYQKLTVNINKEQINQNIIQQKISQMRLNQQNE